MHKYTTPRQGWCPSPCPRRREAIPSCRRSSGFRRTAHHRRAGRKSWWQAGLRNARRPPTGASMIVSVCSPVMRSALRMLLLFTISLRASRACSSSTACLCSKRLSNCLFSLKVFPHRGQRYRWKPSGRLPLRLASIRQSWHVTARSPLIARPKSRILELRGPFGFSRADFDPGGGSSLCRGAIAVLAAGKGFEPPDGGTSTVYRL
jgi:hypothetical protein